jgi:S1-C subfamily serine protease
MKNRLLAVSFYVSLLCVIFSSCSPTSAVRRGTFESYPINDAAFRHYLDSARSNLDPIEGIWTVNATTTVGLRKQDHPNYATVAILRDTANSERDFIEVTLSGEGWQRNAITAHFSKTAYSKVYTAKEFDANASYTMWNFALEESGLLHATTSTIENGWQVEREIYYVKVYPPFEQGKKVSGNRSPSTGTGFLVDRSGLVVTNYHVVEDASNIDVVFPEKHLTKKASVKIKDMKNDLCILKLDDFTFAEISSDEIPYTITATNSAKVGQEVFTLGFPLGDIMGSKSRLSTGLINSEFGIQDDPRVYQISNPLQPGNSGGPLFNNKGELVGVVVSGLNAKYFYENAGIIPQNVNFAVKSTYLSNLLSMIPEGDDIIKRRNAVLHTALENQVEQLGRFVVQIKSN